MAVRCKAAEELVEILAVEKSSLVVSSFRPGVREIDVETFDRGVRDAAFNECGGFGSDYPYV